MIREATLNDMPQLLEGCYEFYKESPFKDFKYSQERVENNIRALIESDTGVVFVYETDRILGMILGSLSQPTISDELVASELSWWVDTSHRNGRIAIELFKAFQRWGLENADFIMMTHPPAHSLSKFYLKQGFSPADVHYLKKVI